jgi:hypothetical protein
MAIIYVPAFFLVFFGDVFLAGVHIRGGIIEGVYGGLFLTTIPTFMLLYVVARVVLLVQAFMTLRSLPPGAYQTVHWTTFIPHI